MRPSAAILAGALVFDLGVLVVAGHAAEAPRAPDSEPAPSVRKAGTKHTEYLKYKLDNVIISGYAMGGSGGGDAKAACELKHGKVIDIAGMPVCQLSSTPVAK
ncbi:MAG: hypothetical protein Q8L66_15140 [Caulobacter sp.]|nr:hypothetical protein [Caulobacter sp.]